MSHKGELELLQNTFLKCHIPVSLFRRGQTVTDPFASPFSEREGASAEHTVLSLLGDLEPRTVYRKRDEFERTYTYFLLENEGELRVLFVGPYLTAPLSAERMLEIGEKNGVSPKDQRYLKEYFEGIPVLDSGDRLLAMLGTFCERVFESPAFSIVDVSEWHKAPASPLHEPEKGYGLGDSMVNIKAMERRYAFENELMEAVSLGQLHKESLLTSALSDQHFEKRASDPLRNFKNYGIIMNTLLRKAAQSGGVHPVYLDQISCDFALRIEQLPTPRQGNELMREMFRAYCRLVHKSSTGHLSRLVQQTVLLIDSDLSAALSLSALAKSQSVSAAYLSAAFKREMGKTVSAYVRDRRVHHAAHLLSTTGLQIQTVALHCGIMDVQYFSKIFKRKMGMTPREYREQARSFHQI